MNKIVPILALVGLGFLIVSGAVQKGLDILMTVIQAFQNAF